MSPPPSLVFVSSCRHPQTCNKIKYIVWIVFNIRNLDYIPFKLEKLTCYLQFPFIAKENICMHQCNIY